MDRTLGGVLLASGILIAGGSGVCSGMFLFNAGGPLKLALFFGGIPFVAGVLLIVGGRALLRGSRKEEPGGQS